MDLQRQLAGGGIGFYAVLVLPGRDRCGWRRRRAAQPD